MANLPAHEKFLRFETLENTTELMRARAVYITGIAFIVMQLVNIFFMTISYGGWTADHGISFVGIVGVIGVIFSLRYTKNFHFFALIYSIMLFAGIGMSASVESTGIDTALLPLLIMGALLNGFVGGWRHILLYGFIALCFIWKLYDVSLTALLIEVSGDAEGKTRLFQRAMQASLALFMTAVCTSLIVFTMTRLFEELDNVLIKLNKTHKQKIDFLARMSEELGRPMAGVNSGLKKLSEQSLSHEESNYMRITQTYARRLSLIISDVITLSNLDKGRFVLRQAPFNLRDEIKTNLKKYESVAKKKGIHIGTTYAAHLPEVYGGDGARMRQILKNLIHNAFKYTEKGSVHVYVDGRLKGADEVTLRISVKDTGVGISDAGMEVVFDRFNPVINNDQTKTFTGTGMELAICREVIEFMGGELHVESQSGVGANFEMTLTLQVAALDIVPDNITTTGAFQNTKLICRSSDQAA